MIEVKVPAEIKYISDWKDFDFSKFSSRCIIDKQIPGCGFTEWAINNPHNVILCSPRKILLENKADQNPNVFLVRCEHDSNIDKCITGPVKKQTITDETLKKIGFEEKQEVSNYAKLYNDISNYCLGMQRVNSPAKILVTYDSFHLVKNILSNMRIFQNFYTVIDEFQAILADSRFKASTELSFMKYLCDIDKVYFVSATPMLEKYIQMLPDFKNLPYYQLDWKSLNISRVVKPNLIIKTMSSINGEASKIISSYLSGSFEKVVLINEQGNITDMESKEAVFYVNSVNHIIGIIKKMGLTPDQCNILCSKTNENEKKLRTKLGSSWRVGTVPLKGQPHKMFTFCTRTVYLGADFYSNNARTFIFSDSNSDCLAVDISMDLPQILGRQRLKENPWKNTAEFYYRTTADYRKMTRENFDSIIQEKLMYTKELLGTYREAATEDRKKVLFNSYATLTVTQNYKQSYVGVSVGEDGKQTLDYNNIVYVADIMAFDIQQVDYADRFVVFNKVSKSISSSNIESSFLDKYSHTAQIGERVKLLCEEYFKNGMNNLESVLDILSMDDVSKSIFLTLGPDRCRALGYNSTNMKKNQMDRVISGKDDLTKAIISEFKINEKITKAEAKERLAKIYSDIGYSRVAKASDLERWFIIQKTRISSDKNIFGIRLTNYKL